MSSGDENEKNHYNGWKGSFPGGIWERDMGFRYFFVVRKRVPCCMLSWISVGVRFSGK